ncbi:MAG: GNAT family N-acetyltransferase [Oscillospiraceae bacterium]|nr:GNAT family N-acetyltransferase [Oscillospiraceae bacterium]
MRLEKYRDIHEFSGDTLEILLENEAQNNLPVSFIYNKTADSSDWFMASVKDSNGGIALVAVCTPPFNIVLYETRNEPDDQAVALLAAELRSMGLAVPGVLALQGLASRFAAAYANGRAEAHMSMVVMELDRVNEPGRAPGRCRLLREDDIFFVPYWERAFSEDCRVEVFDIPTNVERVKRRIGKGVHYIWEDVCPVAQAVHGRSTKCGAVVNGVYTPPHFRNRGYASSVVAELSGELIKRGNRFCCLFADASNPVSRGMYNKIGYRDVCVYDEIRFI